MVWHLVAAYNPYTPALAPISKTMLRFAEEEGLQRFLPLPRYLVNTWLTLPGASMVCKEPVKESRGDTRRDSARGVRHLPLTSLLQSTLRCHKYQLEPFGQKTSRYKRVPRSYLQDLAQVEQQNQLTHYRRDNRSKLRKKVFRLT